MTQKDENSAIRPRLPQWLKVRAPGSPQFIKLKGLMRGQSLHTVCEEAHCPNIGECWDRGTATYMILGEICTRACLYCAVTTGRPAGIDLQEPARLASTVKEIGLDYCVITSVNRDDLSDGGAFIFASCITKIREESPSCKVEVLIPDFGGSWPALQKVMRARPDVLNHNIESVTRVFKNVRPKGDYRLSLELLAKAKDMAPEIPTKSGIIVGMGESRDELLYTLCDLRQVICDLLSIGQYIRRSRKHLPIDRFYSPTDFDELKEAGEAMGFNHVASGPLVRSSYHADQQHAAAQGALPE
mgnify:FL=1